MRFYLAILVSLSVWIASEAESSRIQQRHWRLLDQDFVVSEEPPRRLEQGFSTPAPTDSNTVDGTSDPNNSGGGGVTDSPTSDPNGAGQTTPSPTEAQGDVGGGGGTPAPTMLQEFGGGTPAPTMLQEFGGETPAPTTETQGGESVVASPAPSMLGEFGGTPAPTETQGFADATPAPTLTPWSETPAPTEPYPAPVDPWEAPTPRPEAVYISTDDDPLQPSSSGTEENSAAWNWKDSNVDDVEHDRTVLIALTVTFSVGICLAILTAQQMLENPNGCCVSICRILVALTCGITRCVCYPCRAMCGCTNPDRRNHEIMLQSDDNYTHDLELS